MRTDTTKNSAQRTQRKLALIWKTFGGSVYKRVPVLELAADAMTKGAMNPELESQARAEAHTIHGELSTFGLRDAARISAEIEALFSNPSRRSKSEGSLLVGLILMLRQELEEIRTEPFPTVIQ
jgi:HPt (histidine-containing phosphotransfer) domain-containing protein